MCSAQPQLGTRPVPILKDHGALADVDAADEPQIFLEHLEAAWRRYPSLWSLRVPTTPSRSGPA